MIAAKDLTLAGKVNKTHGVNGEISVSFSSPEFADSLNVGSCLIFIIDGIFVPFFVKGLRPRGNESLLVSLDDIDSQDAAAAFTGKDVYMRTSDVPEYVYDDDESQDGLYASDLVDYTAILPDGTKLGVIGDIDDTTDNVLFVIETEDGNNLLVPVADEFIESIDTDSNTVTLDLPEGLLAL